VPLDKRAAGSVREGDLVEIASRPEKWRRPEDAGIEQIAIAKRRSLRPRGSSEACGGCTALTYKKYWYLDLHNGAAYRPSGSQGVMDSDSDCEMLMPNGSPNLNGSDLLLERRG